MWQSRPSEIILLVQQPSCPPGLDPQSFPPHSPQPLAQQALSLPLPLVARIPPALEHSAAGPRGDGPGGPGGAGGAGGACVTGAYENDWNVALKVEDGAILLQ